MVPGTLLSLDEQLVIILFICLFTNLPPIPSAIVCKGTESASMFASSYFSKAQYYLRLDTCLLNIQ